MYNNSYLNQPLAFASFQCWPSVCAQPPSTFDDVTQYNCTADQLDYLMLYWPVGLPAESVTTVSPVQQSFVLTTYVSTFTRRATVDAVTTQAADPTSSNPSTTGSSGLSQRLHDIAVSMAKYCADPSDPDYATKCWYETFMDTTTTSTSATEVQPTEVLSMQTVRHETCRPQMSTDTSLSCSYFYETNIYTITSYPGPYDPKPTHAPDARLKRGS
jgi:hypothetical protein